MAKIPIKTAMLILDFWMGFDLEVGAPGVDVENFWFKLSSFFDEKSWFFCLVDFFILNIILKFFGLFLTKILEYLK